MKKIVRVNCKDFTINERMETKDMLLLGGRSLTSKVVAEEVEPKCDPLGPENKLVIAGMVLAGSGLSTVNRLSFGGKSPLTGGIKEANVGGTAGIYLSNHGIKALIFEDQPSDGKLRIFVIGADGSYRFEEAEYLREKGNYETAHLLRERFPGKISIISNGIAGERLYANSAIMVTEMGIEKQTRAAARGGLGSVMGSKGIKAIVIERAESPYKFKYDNEAVFRENAKVINETMASRKNFQNGGTPAYLGALIPMKITPYRNFSGGAPSEEELQQFNCDKVLERISSYGGSFGHACQPGCVVKCSTVVHDKEGNYLSAGTEYEGLGLAGPNCMIFDVEFPLWLDRFCDDFGFDSIELSVSIGVYMEAGALEWGDAEGARRMFEGFYQRSEIADDFGMGTEGLGKKHNVKRIPTSKGQAMAAYEPRNLKGTGAVFATSSMGADHTNGVAVGHPGLTPLSKENALEWAIQMQIKTIVTDSHMCLFGFFGVNQNPEAFAKAVGAALGFEGLTYDDITKKAEEIFRKELDFNRRAGFTTEDDLLPEFFYEEPAAATGSQYDIGLKDLVEIGWEEKKYA